MSSMDTTSGRLLFLALVLFFLSMGADSRAARWGYDKAVFGCRLAYIHILYGNKK